MLNNVNCGQTYLFEFELIDFSDSISIIFLMKNKNTFLIKLS